MVKVTNFLVNSSIRFSVKLKRPEEGQERSRGEIRTWVPKSACEVYSAKIDRPKNLTERVKLIFGKSHKLVGQ